MISSTSDDITITIVKNTMKTERSQTTFTSMVTIKLNFFTILRKKKVFIKHKKMVIIMTIFEVKASG